MSLLREIRFGDLATGAVFRHSLEATINDRKTVLLTTKTGKWNAIGADKHKSFCDDDTIVYIKGD